MPGTRTFADPRGYSREYILKMRRGMKPSDRSIPGITHPVPGQVNFPAMDGLGAAPTLTEFASAALVSATEEIEIRTAFSPPYKVKTRDLVGGKPTTEPNPFVRAMKPTVILRGGILGQQVIAPGGVPTESEWKRNALMLAGTVGLLVAGTAGVVFAIGYSLGRKRRA